MDVQEIRGTINIIVLIDANPTDSCMVASLITATEAKSAALRDLDVRSLYTGDSATGSITDSVTVASTMQRQNNQLWRSSVKTRQSRRILHKKSRYRSPLETGANLG